MGYCEDLIKKEVTKTTENIEVIDGRYVFSDTLELNIEEITDLTSFINFIVTDSDGKEYFKCNYCNIDDITILSTTNEPLCTINDPKAIIAKPVIYFGNDKNKIITNVKYKEFSTTFAEKYYAEFTNKLTEKQEVFDINCDTYFRVCGIFHGKEKNGAPMICKIIRNIYYANKYKMVIAPGVDVSFLIVLSFIFIKRSFKELSEKQPAVVVKNYFNEITKKNVEYPNKRICIVDEKYIFQKPQFYKIEKKKHSYYNYIVKDVDDTNIYLSKEKLRSSVLYTNDDEPIIGITDTYEGLFQRKINLGKTNDKCVGSIKTVNSNVLNRFILEFLNKDTNNFEQFLMNCDPDYFVGTIFYDNGQGNNYLVAKIFKDQYFKRNYTIEIAPGVDSIYMLAAAIHFIEKSSLYYSNKFDN